MRRIWLSILLSLTASLAVPGTAAAHPEQLPVHYSIPILVADMTGAKTPFDPPGANDWTCTPTPEHPEPIVLVHGVLGNGAGWPAMSPLLHNHGFCVFSVTYGRYPDQPAALAGVGGLAPIPDSSRELRDFVTRVRATTGADRVNLLAWSEGTLVAAHYLLFEGGSQVVDQIFNLAPIYAGTHAADPVVNTVYGLNAQDPVFAALRPTCQGCVDMLPISDFIIDLQAAGVYAPEVHYTNLLTRADTEVIPYTSGYREAPNATNIVLQDVCPVNLAGHNAISVDPTVAALMLNTFAPGTVSEIPCAPSPYPAM
ncbi:Lipase (class 2) [Nocardia otitidiscaviarum]|uniref:Lipase (Class 2) n=1 Tax=Nocardia otitidiscaviarum TaxID=1823 RepID=A0A378YPC2_9NOCA|nr:alpha/beta fold hydrolase [Nocardia otitidiscaviarum]SUA78992.1 Lipase (class 2) [Nocardia otitidiscaviarum]